MHLNANAQDSIQPSLNAIGGWTSPAKWGEGCLCGLLFLAGGAEGLIEEPESAADLATSAVSVDDVRLLEPKLPRMGPVSMRWSKGGAVSREKIFSWASYRVLIALMDGHGKGGGRGKRASSLMGLLQHGQFGTRERVSAAAVGLWSSRARIRSHRSLAAGASQPK